jgi:adenylate cyclase
VTLLEAIAPTFDWLVDGAPGATTPMAVVERLAQALVTAGVPLERLAAFVRTLHPNVMGRQFEWAPGQPVKVVEASWAITRTDGFKRSPINSVFESGREFHSRFEPETLARYPELAGLRGQGFTDYLICPMKFLGGSTHAVVFGTRAPGGFSEEQLQVLRHVTRPLARVAEILALTRTAANLLSSYVGRAAGGRVLDGRVQRGEVELIRCVIWFSDLRSFTSMSGGMEPPAIIATLNEFFDCQVPAIEHFGGEVLKFIGDGLLAIFPLSKDRGAAEAGRDAVQAAHDAFDALAKLNGVRATRTEEPLSFGVALHLGEVAYGNIGGASRLDFTAIGPAVNLAARIEGLTGKLGKPVLLSEELARQLAMPVAEVGTFELKGVTAKTTVFEVPR